MSRLRFTLSIVLLISVSLTASAQNQDVLIRVIQNESSMLTDFQTNLLLERKPFKFQIMLKNVEGVYVFASVGDSVYRFSETSKIQDFAYLKLLELRDEDVYNTNKELNISETGWSYWFYKPEPAQHAFNRKIAKLDTNRIICTKAIRQLYDVAESKVIRLKEIGKPLYLFFVAVAEYDSDGKPVRELMRRKIKIEWTDED